MMKTRKYISILFLLSSCGYYVEKGGVELTIPDDFCTGIIGFFDEYYKENSHDWREKYVFIISNYGYQKELEVDYMVISRINYIHSFKGSSIIGHVNCDGMIFLVETNGYYTVKVLDTSKSLNEYYFEVFKNRLVSIEDVLITGGGAYFFERDSTGHIEAYYTRLLPPYAW